jgi:short-subunit dehydrogenase
MAFIMNTANKQSVFITGASQGLGRQMAIEFARRGYDLALSARRESVLEELRQEITQFSDVRVKIYALDVCDVAAVQKTLPRASRDFGKMDIVVANAGLGNDHKIGTGDFEDIKNIIDLNITGAFAMVDTAVRVFRQQGFGQIVGLSSLAGIRGLPYTGTYGASKAALTIYLEALRIEAWGTKLDVTVLTPGYIDTAMNQHVPNRPFVIPVEKGGRILVDLIIRKVKRAYVPAIPWRLLAPLIKRLPDSVIAKMFL